MTREEKHIAHLMATLNCSEVEARDIVETDKRIDRGEKLFELPPELAQGAKKARQAPRTTVYQFKPRERKADNDKRFLIDALVWALTTDADKADDNVNATDIDIQNPEREFTFNYNGKKYKVVLSCPRS